MKSYMDDRYNNNKLQMTSGFYWFLIGLAKRFRSPSIVLIFYITANLTQVSRLFWVLKKPPYIDFLYGHLSRIKLNKIKYLQKKIYSSSKAHPREIKINNTYSRNYSNKQGISFFSSYTKSNLVWQLPICERISF